MKFLIDLLLSLMSSSKRKELQTIKKEASVDIKLLDARVKELLLNDPIKYKEQSERLKREHLELASKNPALYNLLGDLDTYVFDNFKKNVVITMIYRTQAEQDYLYRNSDQYKKRKFKSPHQFHHAIDIRSRTFSNEEINQIVAWLNAKYDSDNYYSWTSKCHDVGSGAHFHLQFVRK